MHCSHCTGAKAAAELGSTSVQGSLSFIVHSESDDGDGGGYDDRTMVWVMMVK